MHPMRDDNLTADINLAVTEASNRLRDMIVASGLQSLCPNGEAYNPFANPGGVLRRPDEVLAAFLQLPLAVPRNRGLEIHEAAEEGGPKGGE